MSRGFQLFSGKESIFASIFCSAKLVIYNEMRLKEIRKNRGITQLKLAMDLNISQNTISRYETGEREADYTTLIRLADYFNVSLDYLLERTDDPTFYKK